ncbi:hypothetical protein J6500_11335 [Bradyrhizobium sp. WSM 1704]|uniref:hypothetical protein n=1 Tax=Bradyrhizobium semiaridum TaxID=2821404 RepID=UPI001CE269BB|nr:hypothetical protein [Bradyrhizobium semiaridum]MCA6122479.1 hypothetical protein [Bradyrhizobium semiaridum]
MLIALLFAAGNDLDRIFNLWLALVPLLFLPALAVAVYWTVALVRHLWFRRWRRVASIIAAPIAAWLIFAGARGVGITRERIRFEIEKHHYVELVDKLARTGEPRLALMDWEQTGGAGTANSIYTLVFDEADEITLGPERRSKAWRDRARRLCPGTAMCAVLEPPVELSITVNKLDGHFYLATMAW